MDKSEYRLIYKEGSAETEEKKSRFIADVYIVKDEEQAVGYITAVKKKYWNASHHCFAYVLGDNCEIQRFSDDGEPQGTAGKLILDVLMGNHMHNCLIVVTRYFGGTLLGTGGLVRAYGSAAKAGLGNSIIAEKIRGRKLVMQTDYNELGKIQYLVTQEEFTVEEIQYTDTVTMTIVCPDGKTQEFIDKIAEILSGKNVLLENVRQDIIMPLK